MVTLVSRCRRSPRTSEGDTDESGLGRSDLLLFFLLATSGEQRMFQHELATRRNQFALDASENAEPLVMDGSVESIGELPVAECSSTLSAFAIRTRHLSGKAKLVQIFNHVCLPHLLGRRSWRS